MKFRDYLNEAKQEKIDKHNEIYNEISQSKSSWTYGANSMKVNDNDIELYYSLTNDKAASITKLKKMGILPKGINNQRKLERGIENNIWITITRL